MKRSLTIATIGSLAIVGVASFSCVARTSVQQAEIAARKPKIDTRSWEEAAEKALKNNGSLDQIMQKKETRKACMKYFSGWKGYLIRNRGSGADEHTLMKNYIAQANKETVLLCGKGLFMYESPSRQPVPKIYLQKAMQVFDDIGPAFENAGLIPDPDDKNFPIGMPPYTYVPGKQDPSLWVPSGKRAPTRRVACVMCHMAEIGNDYYSIGMTNENINYGAIFKALTLPIYMMDSKENTDDKFPKAIDDAFDQMQAELGEEGGLLFPEYGQIPAFKIFGRTFGPIRFGHVITAVAGLTRFTPEEAAHLFESNEPGLGPVFFLALGRAQRLFINPPTLWSIASYMPGDPRITTDDKGRPRKQEVLGMITIAHDLEDHIDEANIIATSDVDYFNPLFTVPISEFIRTLKAPEIGIPQMSDAEIEEAKVLFTERKCQSCHASEAYGGIGFVKSKKMFTNPEDSVAYEMYEQAIAGQMAADANERNKDLQPSNDLSKKTIQILQETFPEKALKVKGLKPKRLAGVRFRGRLMSNGKVRGLNHAFCLNGKKREEPNPKTPELTEKIHDDLCTLEFSERLLLVKYLRTL